MGAAAAEDSVHADPVQMKWGLPAAPLPLAELRPAPVTMLQIRFASGKSRRTSRPFSLSPPQVAMVAVLFVVAQVRIALCTSCVGVKASTGGRSAGPCGPVAPLGPVGPAGPVVPFGPVAPAGPVAPFGPVGPAGPVAPFGPVGPGGLALRSGSTRSALARQTSVGRRIDEPELAVL
jgi:hypothetical protein